MEPNPFLGVVLHAIGGLAAASFYIPYKGVKNWAWEKYWLLGGFFSWIVAPWVLAMSIVPQTPVILRESDPRALAWTFLWGVIWGVGGLTFGLTMRYLGIALGYAIALGLCAAFGTLVPPIYHGKWYEILTTASGQWVLLGVLVCLIGIAISGMAGISKEKELSDEQKKATVKEFSLVKGLLVAVLCGVMSAAMAFAFDAGKPIAQVALDKGCPPLWQNLPVLIVVLLGGFLTNATWCVALGIKNRSWSADPPGGGSRSPFLTNCVLCAVAGVTWYFQFFFYSMGTTKMGKYDFSSWTLHMASIIIFSTVWGIALKEWRGTRKRTHVLIGVGLATLILSTVVVGYGNYLGTLAH